MTKIHETIIVVKPDPSLEEFIPEEPDADTAEKAIAKNTMEVVIDDEE